MFGPRHMMRRNGADVETALPQCDNYRPDCDLSIVAADGATVAYGQFWPDLVTGVGLTEPMRTEDEHQGVAWRATCSARGCAGWCGTAATG